MSQCHCPRGKCRRGIGHTECEIAKNDVLAHRDERLEMGQVHDVWVFGEGEVDAFQKSPGSLPIGGAFDGRLFRYFGECFVQSPQHHDQCWSHLFLSPLGVGQYLVHVSAKRVDPGVLSKNVVNVHHLTRHT